MPNEPQLHTLPLQQRARFFWFLVLVFAVAVPAVVFHTTGYRLTFIEDKATITPTGGVYLSTMSDEVEVFVDEVQVATPRLFRSAYYIQNLPAGQRRIVVQGEGLQTWVKELPIDPYLVTEAMAFTLPQKPIIRPIAPWESSTGTLVVYEGVVPDWYSISSTTLTLETAPTTTATSSNFIPSEEYVFIDSLFGTTTRTSVLQPAAPQLPPFRFATSSELTELATTGKQQIIKSDIRLHEMEGELYAEWIGPVQRTPYYYCVLNADEMELAGRYGDHVASQITQLRTATSSVLWPSSSGRVCRPEIRIDRMQQDVFWFEFVPGQRDLVLLLLEDGLYVTEIDDRSWQNSQRILAGTDFQVRLFGSQIYIKEGEWIGELVLEIES